MTGVEGPVFDRSVEWAWLDKAFELACSGTTDTRSQMEFWLRDRVASPTGRQKTLTTLTLIWLRPELEDPRLLEWARVHGEGLQDWRALHVGAMFAAYPFFASACGVIGRELSLESQITAAELCIKMRRLWGDRGVIDVGTWSVVRTLRSLGVLVGDKGRSTSAIGERIQVGPDLMPWLAHAWLLSRGVLEMGLREIEAAAEMFMITPPTVWAPAYPNGEIFNEGSGRRVFRIRRMPTAPAPQGYLFR